MPFFRLRYQVGAYHDFLPDTTWNIPSLIAPSLLCSNTVLILFIQNHGHHLLKSRGEGDSAIEYVHLIDTWGGWRRERDRSYSTFHISTAWTYQCLYCASCSDELRKHHLPRPSLRSVHARIGKADSSFRNDTNGDVIQHAGSKSVTSPNAYWATAWIWSNLHGSENGDRLLFGSGTSLGFMVTYPMETRIYVRTHALFLAASGR